MSKLCGVHWDKWRKQWRCYQDLTYSLLSDLYLEEVFFMVVPEGHNTVASSHLRGQPRWNARIPHAFAFGKLLSSKPEGEWIDIRYNPFEHQYIMRLDTNKPVAHAKYVLLNPPGRGEIVL
jgi:hypothetical protein